MKPPTLLAVVLAAGNSRRLGEPKQLLKFRDSDLLSHTCATLNGVLDAAPLVILGAKSAEIFASLHRKPDYLLINSHWPEGMSSSIRCAVEAIPKSVDGLLLCVCDQPLISAEHYQALRDGFRCKPEAIHASVYPSGKPGVPAIVPRRLFSELLTLKGDRGAQTLFFHDTNVHRYPCPAAEIDIDTADDQQSLRDRQ